MKNVRETLRIARAALFEARRAGRARRVAVLTMMTALSVVTATVLYSAVSRPRVAPSVRMVKVVGRRGAIRDRSGTLLAQTVTMSRVIIVPQEIGKRLGAHRNELVLKLAEVLSLDLKTVHDAVYSDQKRVRIKRKTVTSEVRALHALKLGPDKRERPVVGAGIEIEPEHFRYYPNGTAAAQVLGFIDHTGKGVEGLEATFDSVLRGKTIEVPSMMDARGRVVLSDVPLDSKEADGADLTLTLDLRLQVAAEDALAAGVESAGAKAGQVVIIEPHTGALLALANYPMFDPNRRDDDPEPRRNRAVTAAFEPGSVMKIFTAAGALEAGVVSEDEQIDCGPGIAWVGRTPIRDTHAHGPLTIAGIIARSSNIGAMRIGARLGRADLRHTLVDFGFGTRVGLPLPREATGMLRPLKGWTDLYAANVSFGQGMAATGVQVAAAVSVIANGGSYLPPRLIESPPSARVAPSDAAVPTGRRVIRADVARRVMQLMRGVTEAGGTGASVRIPGVTIASKTGTAQKALPGRGYKDGAYVASFVGFVPAEEPALVISVAIDEPLRTHLGGAVAGPVFQRVATESIHILRLPLAPGTYAAGPSHNASTRTCRTDAGALRP